MEINGYYININKEIGESYQSYLERCIFIGMNLKNNSLSREEIIKKSKFYRSIKFLGCKYNQKIHEDVDKLSKNANLCII